MLLCSVYPSSVACLSVLREGSLLFGSSWGFLPFFYPLLNRVFFSQYGRYILTQIEGLGTEDVVHFTDWKVHWGIVIVILVYINTKLIWLDFVKDWIFTCWRLTANLFMAAHGTCLLNTCVSCNQGGTAKGQSAITVCIKHTTNHFWYWCKQAPTEEHSKIMLRENVRSVEAKKILLFYFWLDGMLCLNIEYKMSYFWRWWWWCGMVLDIMSTINTVGTWLLWARVDGWQTPRQGVDKARRGVSVAVN